MSGMAATAARVTVTSVPFILLSAFAVVLFDAEPGQAWLLGVIGCTLGEMVDRLVERRMETRT